MSARTQSSIGISLEHLAAADSPYRILDELLDFNKLAASVADIYSYGGRKIIGENRALRLLIVQFPEDRSDREMERHMSENHAAQRFCYFNLGEKTPHHSFYGKFRKRLGSKRLMKLFGLVRESLKQKGLVREVFTFADSCRLISKLSTWTDRDKAIAQGLKKFNSRTAKQAASDPQARFGCKGNKQFFATDISLMFL